MNWSILGCFRSSSMVVCEIPRSSRYGSCERLQGHGIDVGAERRITIGEQCEIGRLRAVEIAAVVAAQDGFRLAGQVECEPDPRSEGVRLQRLRPSKLRREPRWMSSRSPGSIVSRLPTRQESWAKSDRRGVRAVQDVVAAEIGDTVQPAKPVIVAAARDSRRRFSQSSARTLRRTSGCARRRSRTRISSGWC